MKQVNIILDEEVKSTFEALFEGSRYEAHKVDGLANTYTIVCADVEEKPEPKENN